MDSSDRVEERVVGVLFGLAAGDRNGGPVRMAVRVAESLVARRGLDLADIGRRYLDWWREGAFDTGPTVAGVLGLVEAGTPFEQAAALVDDRCGGMTAGCNPAHRCAPLAMCRSISDAALGPAAAAEAALTHRHPLAGEAAAVVACLCRAMIRGVPWRIALGAASQGRSDEIRRALETPAARSIRADGFAPEALGAAIQILDAADSFSEALARSIEVAGGANYCPVIVGSIGGARWGRAAVDRVALDPGGELRSRLDAVAAELAAPWAAPFGETSSGHVADES